MMDADDAPELELTSNPGPSEAGSFSSINPAAGNGTMEMDDMPNADPWDPTRGAGSSHDSVTAIENRDVYYNGFEEIRPICKNVLEPNLQAKDMPFPRSGHRLVANDRYAVSIGGFNPSLWNEHNTPETYYPILKEVWVFNLLTSRWKLLDTSGIMPKELASHAAVLHDNYVLVYGGTGVPFGHNSSNKLYALNVKTGKWRVIPTAPAENDNIPAIAPPEQYGHAFVRNRNKLYITGGTSGFDYNMQVFELTMHGVSDANPQGGYKCRSLLRGAELVPRYRHEAFFFDGKLHVLGGGTTNTVCPMENVDVFDVASGLWTPLPIQPDPVNGQPAARRCHGLAVYEEPFANGQRLSVYICGGYNGTDTFDDVWELKISRAGSAIEYSWRKFSHNLPRSLYFHGMTATPNGSLLVFGGVDGETGERSAKLYRCWLKPPSLLESTLRKVMTAVGDLDENQLLRAAKELYFPETCMDWLKSRW
jgi:hypothetical protein